MWEEGVAYRREKRKELGGICSQAAVAQKQPVSGHFRHLGSHSPGSAVTWSGNRMQLVAVAMVAMEIPEMSHAPVAANHNSLPNHVITDPGV